jgi:hypothetical protein
LQPLAGHELDPQAALGFTPRAILGGCIGSLGARLHRTGLYCPKFNHLQIMNHLGAIVKHSKARLLSIDLSCFGYYIY